MSYIGTKPADAVLRTQDISDGIVTTDKLADNSVTTAKTSFQDAPFRNIIINGGMDIAQRGTSTASITGDGYHTIDRFKTSISGLGTWTQSQSTDVPSGQGFAKSLKMDCTTADASPASSDVLIINQRIEGQNLQYLKKGTSSAESLTLSFWVKSNKTGTYIAELRDFDNTRSICKAYTISSASTWEKKTLTFAGDTTGTLDNDNGASFYLQLFLGAGSNYTSGTLNTSWNSRTTANLAVGQVNLADSTSNEWYITGVQLEAGTTASDFEFLPHDVNLYRCLRYYEKAFDLDVTPAEGGETLFSGGQLGVIGYVTNTARTNVILFKADKRADPTITIYRGNNTTNGQFGYWNGSWQNGSNSLLQKITNKGFGGQLNGTFNQFSVYLLAFGWTADAEL